MKKLLFIIIGLLLIIGFIFLISFVNREHKNIRCTKEVITINSSGGFDFVNRTDIELLLHQYDRALIGKYISEIDNQRIEKKILENPFVSSADVYTTNDGSLKINVTQRKPLLRVINSHGDSYYLDEEGKMMPLSNKYTVRLIIAHGAISNDYSPAFKLINFSKKLKLDTNKLTDLQKVYFLVKYINRSDFWRVMVDNIYVNPDGDIELYLYIGNQEVILGGIDNLGEKFTKLEQFYRQKMCKLGWSKYKSISVKYKNQIVCSKI